MIAYRTKSITATLSLRISRAFLSIILIFVTIDIRAASLDFDKTFNANGESKQLHYLATYTVQDKPHRVEVWREKDQRLKRRTDDVIETFVFKSARQVEWQMVVLDLKHKIRTDIERTNLYRIGHFTDWFALSHSLTRPTMPYQLTAATKPVTEEAPVADCRWYALIREGSVSKICWSSVLRLPLLITGPDNQVQWRVTHVDARALVDATFQIRDQGFVRNNANEDINAD